MNVNKIIAHLLVEISAKKKVVNFQVSRELPMRKLLGSEKIKVIIFYIIVKSCKNLYGF
jgi:hypothetical protein